MTTETLARAAPAATYAPLAEQYSLIEFLEGRTRAWGIFEDRFGRVRRRFSATLTGVRQGGVLVVTEDFVFDDGETARKVWRFAPRGDGTFAITATDVVGEAIGESRADAIEMRYTYRLDLGSRTLDVAYHDWFYRLDSRRLLNRARLAKWGLLIGTVTVTFERVD